MGMTALRCLVLFSLSAWLQAGAAETLPLDRIKLPPGFEISLYARVPGARSLALGARGTVFVGTREPGGTVYAIAAGSAPRRVLALATGLDYPNGVAYREGSLYVGEVGRVLRYDHIEDRLEDPPPAAVAVDGLPREYWHGWRYIAFGPDGLLYIPVGAPCNVCEADPDRFGLILRMQPDGTHREVLARGVRNSVGFDWDPRTKAFWFNDHGRDNLGDDLPSDELNQVSTPGQHFGFPYCHQGDTPDPQFGANRACREFVPPVYKHGAHVAADGLRFYTATAFPARYHNRVFVAQHGSWNRSHKVGYRVVTVDVTPGRPVTAEVFAEGWLRAEHPWGRPVDLLVMPDGALLLSDDLAGAVYRIAYGG